MSYVETAKMETPCCARQPAISDRIPMSEKSSGPSGATIEGGMGLAAALAAALEERTFAKRSVNKADLHFCAVSGGRSGRVGGESGRADGLAGDIAGWGYHWLGISLAGWLARTLVGL